MWSCPAGKEQLSAGRTSCLANRNCPGSSDGYAQGMPPRRQGSELTEREERFCLEYVRNNCNGTKAAKAAGYAGTEAVLAVTASQVLGRTKVQERLRELRKDVAMDATEVLQRLTEIARNSIEPFLNETTNEIDLARARELGVLHLAEEITQRERRRQGPSGQVELEVVTRVKLHSALDALRLLAKHHALLTDVQEVRDLPKDERRLDALIEHHLKRTLGPEKAAIVIAALRGQVH